MERVGAFYLTLLGAIGFSVFALQFQTASISGHNFKYCLQSTETPGFAESRSVCFTLLKSQGQKTLRKRCRQTQHLALLDSMEPPETQAVQSDANAVPLGGGQAEDRSNKREQKEQQQLPAIEGERMSRAWPLRMSRKVLAWWPLQQRPKQASTVEAIDAELVQVDDGKFEDMLKIQQELERSSKKDLKCPEDAETTTERLSVPEIQQGVKGQTARFNGRRRDRLKATLRKTIYEIKTLKDSAFPSDEISVDSASEAPPRKRRAASPINPPDGSSEEDRQADNKSLKDEELKQAMNGNETAIPQSSVFPGKTKRERWAALVSKVRSSLGREDGQGANFTTPIVSPEGVNTQRSEEGVPKTQQTVINMEVQNATASARTLSRRRQAVKWVSSLNPIRRPSNNTLPPEISEQESPVKIKNEAPQPSVVPPPKGKGTKNKKTELPSALPSFLISPEGFQGNRTLARLRKAQRSLFGLSPKKGKVTSTIEAQQSSPSSSDDEEGIWSFLRIFQGDDDKPKVPETEFGTFSARPKPTAEPKKREIVWSALRQVPIVDRFVPKEDQLGAYMVRRMDSPSNALLQSLKRVKSKDNAQNDPDRNGFWKRLNLFSQSNETDDDPNSFETSYKPYTPIETAVTVPVEEAGVRRASVVENESWQAWFSSFFEEGNKTDTAFQIMQLQNENGTAMESLSLARVSDDPEVDFMPSTGLRSQEAERDRASGVEADASQSGSWSFPLPSPGKETGLEVTNISSTVASASFPGPEKKIDPGYLASIETPQESEIKGSIVPSSKVKGMKVNSKSTAALKASVAVMRNQTALSPEMVPEQPLPPKEAFVNIGMQAVKYISSATQAEEYLQQVGLKEVMLALKNGDQAEKASGASALERLSRFQPERVRQLIQYQWNAFPDLHALIRAPLGLLGINSFLKNEQEKEQLISAQLAAAKTLLNMALANDSAIEDLRQIRDLGKTLRAVVNAKEYGALELQTLLNRSGKTVESLAKDSQKLCNMLLGCLGLYQWTPKSKGQRGVRILCLDGGGTKGVLTIAMLKKIKEATGKEPYDFFDFICGTSTGAIIAFLICLMREDVESLEKRYDSLIKEIFYAGSTTKLLIQQAYYNEQNWERILKEILDDRLVLEGPDANTPKLFAVSTLFNYDPQQLWLWKNYNYPPGQKSRYRGTFRELARNALRATTAAPTYFYPLEKDGNLYSDGALIANNPTAVAYQEAGKIFPGVPIELVVSLGTGYSPCQEKEPQSSWNNIVSQLINSATDTELIDGILADVISNAYYFRMNPNLESSYEIDETSTERLNSLKQTAQSYFDNPVNQRRLDQLSMIARGEAPPSSASNDFN